MALAFKGLLLFFLFAFPLRCEVLQVKLNLDIPVTRSEEVNRWIKIYTNEKKGDLEYKLDEVESYIGLMREILKDYELPDDLRFLTLLSSRKRTWDILYTDRLFKLKVDWYRDERKDPLKSTIATVDYLNRAYEKKKNWDVVLEDYFQSIRRFSSKEGPTPDEFYALAIIGKNLKFFGFKEINEKVSLDFEEVKVSSLTDLRVVSSECNIPLDQLQKLNKELKRSLTPPGKKDYFLRIPPDKVDAFLQCSLRQSFQVTDLFTLKLDGEYSLSTLAGMYKVPVYVLADLNQHIHGGLLKKNDLVKLPFPHAQGEELLSVLNRNKKNKLVKKLLRYTVKKGDSLLKISRSKNISLKDIFRLNKNLHSKSKLKAGSVIFFN